MNHKIKGKISTLFMLVILFAQTLTPVVTVFAEDTTSGTQASSEVQSVNETLSSEKIQAEGVSTTSASSSTSMPASENKTAPTSSSAEVSTSTEPATSASNEVAPVSPEETSATEESTEEDEDPAQSSTGTSESTSESTEASSAKSKKTLKRTPGDIRDLSEFENQKIFVAPLEIKVGGFPVTELPVTVKENDLFEIGYNWEIPEALENVLIDGDWYEIDLPTGLAYVDVPADGLLKDSTGLVYGNYSFAGGKLKLTFNKNIEGKTNVKGTVWYGQEISADEEAGEKEILVNLDGDKQGLPIFIQPSGGSSISKKESNKKESGFIYWDVSINTKLEKLTNITVTEQWPTHTEYDSVTVYTQAIDVKGNVLNDAATELVKGTDYTVDSNGVVTLIGKYQSTNESFRISYKSSIKESEIPAEGGAITFNNKASLTSAENPKQIDATASTSRTYGKFLNKSGSVDPSNPRIYNWTIEFNYGEKILAAGTWLKDKLDDADSSIVKGSINITTPDGQAISGLNYQLTPTDPTGQEFEIKFPNGVDRQKIKITYQTKYNKVISGNDKPNITNKVTTNVNEKGGTAGTGEITLGAKDSQGVGEFGLSKSSRVDYNNHVITWTIDVNPGQYLMKDWELTDTLTGNQTLNNDVKIFEYGSGTALTQTTDYTITSDNKTTFTLAFAGARKTGTDKRYTITYTTTFDPRTNTGELKNTAEHSWIDEFNQPQTTNRPVTPEIDDKFINDVTKSGAYNAKEKEITWTIGVNYMQDTLVNAEVRDVLENDPKQIYVDGSVKVYEVTVNSDGTTKRGNVVSPSKLTEPKDPQRELIVGLPNNSKKTYEIEFKTILGDRVIKAGETIKNKASYTNNGQTAIEETTSVKIDHAGNHLEKDGKQDGFNYAKWEIMINKAQSTLNDVTIVDKPSANLAVDLSTLAVYKTKIDQNVITKTNEKLEQGTDYTVDLVIDNDSGEQTLTIKFLETIKTSYVLEYRTLVMPVVAGAAQDAGNDVSITAKDVVLDNSSEKKNIVVNVSGGSASSQPAGKFVIKKTDKTNSQPIEGVSFELWSMNEDGITKQNKIRDGKTDAKGELNFGGLRTETNYLLIEKSTPKGYVIGGEYKNGKIITIAQPNTEYEITNDTFAVSFIKKSDNTQGLTSEPLAGAEFILQRTSDNKYYQGNQQGVSDESNWLTDKAQASIFISTDKGKVQAKGLLEGSYKFIETKAPSNYILETKEVPFTIAANEQNGQLSVSNIGDVINKRELTSITVNKKWANENQHLSTRPEKVVIQILRKKKTEADTSYKPVNGIANQEIDIKAEKDSVTFEGLVKYDDAGELFDYSAIEVDPDKQYTAGKAVVDSTTKNITITNTLKTTDISVKKDWKDSTDEESRPKSIQVQLLSKVKGNAESVPVANIPVLELSNLDNWKGSFEDLPTHNSGGAELEYSVKELNVNKNSYTPSYTSAGDTRTITNTLNTKADFMVTKKWNDETDNSLRPTEIKVQLYRHVAGKEDEKKAARGVQTISETTANESEPSVWKITYSGLAAYDIDGNEYIYSVEEVDVQGNYDPEYNGLTIENILKTIDIPVEKRWNDSKDTTSRPEEITVDLYRYIEGENRPIDAFKTVKLTANEDWKYQFTGLAAENSKGKPFIYELMEQEVKGYTSEVNNISKALGQYNYRITNELKSLDIPVEKHWNDSGDTTSRPTNITVDLYRYIQGGARPTDPFKTVQLTADKNWKYEFEDLASENSSGKSYIYELAEREVKAYTSEVTNISNVVGQYNYKIVNELKSLNIPVEKHWNDSHDTTSRPTNIIIDLYRYVQGETRPTDAFKTVQLTANDHWKYEFKDLALENSSGELYTYELEEQEVKAYTSEVVNISKAIGQYNYRVTNELIAIDIPVRKIWNDQSDISIRENKVIIDLHRTSDPKGEPVPVSGHSLSLSQFNNWQSEFTGLAKADKDGKEFIYSIKERGVSGYTTKITGSQTEGFKVTNTLELTQVNVTKNWSDFSNKFGLRPDAIHLQLMKRVGKELVPVEKQTIDSNGEIKTTIVEMTLSDTVKENNQQSAVFSDLTKYDENGDEIQYAVTETPVTGYETSIANVTSEIEGQQNINITNTLETTTIPVTKTWADDNNRYGLRPASITVSLYQNGQEFKIIAPVEMKPNKEGEWNYTFTDLPKVDTNGKAYEYTLFEATVHGYEGEINQDTGEITNTLETISIPVRKIWKDTFKETENYYKSRPESITIRLLQGLSNDGADGVEIEQIPAEKLVAKAGVWSHTFEDLPKYNAKGEEYIYTIKEDSVDKYKQVIEGNAKDGFEVTNTRKSYAIGDYTWIDTNKDGIQDANEEVLVGVIVELFDETGTIKIGETTTDENGRYLFDELEDGKYTIKFTLTEEQAKTYEFTKQDSGKDNKVDSDADHLTGWTTTITLNDDSKELTKDYKDQEFQATEGIDPTWDAGVILREKIDITGTKVWVGGPKVKPTIEFQLYRNGEALGESVELKDGTTTYTWKDLYKTDTNKEAYVYTVQEVGTPSEYNKTEQDLTVTNTRKTYAIGDYTWIDMNKDGIQDKNEPILPGVKVELFDENGKKIAETTTDENGRYLFDELESGKYKVKFTLTSEQKKHYKFTKRHSGDTAKDSNADEEGWTIDIDLNESNAFLTLDYADQTFKASEGMDPTWDAGVVLIESGKVPGTGGEKPSTGNKAPTTANGQKPLPQMGEAGNPVLLTTLGILLIGSVTGVVTARRRRKG